MCAQLCPTVFDPMDCSPRAPMSLGFSRQVGSDSLLQGIVLAQGLNLHLLRLLHWQAGSLPLPHLAVLQPVNTYLLNWLELVSQKD